MILTDETLTYQQKDCYWPCNKAALQQLEVTRWLDGLMVVISKSHAYCWSGVAAWSTIWSDWGLILQAFCIGT